MIRANKEIILAIFTFIIFAVTMVYAEEAGWIMVIALISFLIFLNSIHQITKNKQGKSSADYK